MGNGETIFGVNAMGTIHINEVVSKYMKQGGTIIDVSSMSAYMLPAEQVPYQVYELALENEEGFKQGALAMLNAVPQEMQQDMAYTVSKNFVLWYAKKSALKLGKDGIRVISVSPGTFDTPMGKQKVIFRFRWQKTGRWAGLENLKRLPACLSFLVSDGASYITGTDILCDGWDDSSRPVSSEVKEIHCHESRLFLIWMASLSLQIGFITVHGNRWQTVLAYLLMNRSITGFGA